MIRENQKYFNGFQVLLDHIIIYISFILAYYIRFKLLKDGVSSFSLQQSLWIISAMLPIYWFSYSQCDLYTSRRVKPFINECISIIYSNILAVFIFIVGLYVVKEMNFSRKTLFFFLLINPFLTILYRGGIRLFLKRYRKKGYNQKHCLIIGTSNIASELIKKIHTHTYWGYRILGCLSIHTKEQDTFLGYKVLGNIKELPHILEAYYVDYIMVAIDEQNSSNLSYILKCSEKAGIKVHIIPYYYQYIPAKPYIDDLDGLPIIDTRHIPLDNFFKMFLKRMFDIVFSLVALILTSPLLLITALLVKLTSKGPILFKQERIGLNRKPFIMYKFRSMKVQDEEVEKSQWTSEKDPRKTWWGTIIRRTSIDEFPQFINVLKGDMSIVGPRPERPYFVEQFKEEIPRYMIKHQVRPGITGWAQVNGLRGDTSIIDRIQYDLYYIENWTFSFDMKIILLTILKGFINKNAY